MLYRDTRVTITLNRDTMKKMNKAILILICFLSIGIPSKAQNRWVEDQEMGFKISVPGNYKVSQTTDGSDKIHVFVSPDENVAVQVRSFAVAENAIIELIMNAFSQNVIKGAQQLVNQDHVLNDISGKIAGYRWKYNNRNIIVGAFCTIRNGTAFIVWSLIPENLFAKRTAESDAITNSFTLIQTQLPLAQSLGGLGSLGGLKPDVPMPPATEPVTQEIIQNSTTPAVQELNKVQQNTIKASSDYTTLVSDDACIEHAIPKSATLRKADQGQKIWDIPIGITGKNVTMILQNVMKQGKNFNTFMNEQITSIKERGATVRSSNFSTSDGMANCNYWYEFNGSMFLYTAIDGPNSFFMLGFVGSIDYEGDVTKYHKAVQTTFKQAPCAGQQISALNKENTATEVSSLKSNYKQIVLDNKNSGYDFATGKVRDGLQAPDPDVLNEAWCTELPAICGNWAKTGKSKMEEVMSPPASGYISDSQSFPDCQETPLNEVLVFKLKDGKFAKLIIVKDDRTKTGNECEHKITCLVEYPAFTSGQASVKSSNNELSGFWPHSARLTQTAPNNAQPISGFKKFYQYGEFSFQVPENWKSQSQSGRTVWYNPKTDGGLITHIQLRTDASFEKLVNTASTNELKNLGTKTIGGFETCLHQTKSVVGMQNNIILRTDVVYIKTDQRIHMLTFQANENIFNDSLEPYAIGLLNSLVKN